MPGSSNNNSENKSVDGTVAGYFASRDDAQRAIGELLADGFGSREIGAAFHDGKPLPSRTGGTAKSMNDIPIHATERRGATISGSTSDVDAVRSPWGLSTGGGSVFAGAGAPGPIPGSEIPPDLPTNIPSELPSDRNSRSLEESRTCAYSGSAFESSFLSMGIPKDHARRLSQVLRQGGAIVTVRAGSRSAAAETIMERNRGTIRYEAGPSEESAAENGDRGRRVEVFGEIHRVYPVDTAEGEEFRDRKAS